MRKNRFWVVLISGLGCLAAFGATAQQVVREPIGPAIPAVAVEGMEEDAPSPALPVSSKLRITVNIPSFQLVLWQGGEILETYPIGIAQKSFPVAPGHWTASEVIWNPAWIPPDSRWVDKRRDVHAGEYIPATDRRNPLGKIKIPLGKGYLIHQAAKSSDLGNLVSHGCIRVMVDDLEDLARKIVMACAPRVSQEQIAMADQTLDQFPVVLSTALPVDISYETIVIDNGLLRIYPDVYDYGTNTAENLRQKLAQAGLNPDDLDWRHLDDMLASVRRHQAYVIAIDDVRNRATANAGWYEPLVDPEPRGHGREAKSSLADAREEASPRKHAPRD